MSEIFHHHKPNLCPGCGEILTASQGVKEDVGVPSPGDFSVCFYCGSILSYDADLNLTLATVDALADMLAEDPDQFQHLIQVRQKILENLSPMKAVL